MGLSTDVLSLWVTAAFTLTVGVLTVVVVVENWKGLLWFATIIVIIWLVWTIWSAA